MHQTFSRLSKTFKKKLHDVNLVHILSFFVSKFQKQPGGEGRGSRKKVFLKICKIHNKTPASESFFNEAAGLRPEDCKSK